MRVEQGGAADGQRFEIVKPLGSGGLGTVSEAFDRLSSERVALKELTRVSPSALFRFKQEFRALADIHHANLVRLREPRSPPARPRPARRASCFWRRQCAICVR